MAADVVRVMDKGRKERRILEERGILVKHFVVEVGARYAQDILIVKVNVLLQRIEHDRSDGVFAQLCPLLHIGILFWEVRPAGRVLQIIAQI